MADDYIWSHVIGSELVSEIAGDGSVVVYEVITTKRYKCQLHGEHVGSVVQAVRARTGDMSLVVPMRIIENAFLKGQEERWIYGMWQHRSDCPMVAYIIQSMGIAPPHPASVAIATDCAPSNMYDRAELCRQSKRGTHNSRRQCCPITPSHQDQQPTPAEVP